MRLKEKIKSHLYVYNFQHFGSTAGKDFSASHSMTTLFLGSPPVDYIFVDHLKLDLMTKEQTE